MKIYDFGHEEVRENDIPNPFEYAKIAVQGKGANAQNLLAGEARGGTKFMLCDRLCNAIFEPPRRTSALVGRLATPVSLQAYYNTSNDFYF